MRSVPRGARAAPALAGQRRVVALGLAGLTVAAAVVTGYQCFLVGDSGARAVWGDRTWTVQQRFGPPPGR